MSDAPHNPRGILALALIVPGAGHVRLGLAQRGLMFLFFTVVLAWASSHVMPETSSFIGRHIGGVFIYGMSVIDAYRIAKLRMVTWQAGKAAEANPSSGS
jgi:hypothetical protein